MSQPFVASLIGQIRQILTTADLNSVSAKAIRKTLIQRGIDAELIKANKEEIDANIAEIFNEIRSGPSGVPANAAGTDTKPSMKRSASDLPQPNPIKRPKVTGSDKPIDDESYARALQAELNGISGSRSSRSGQTRTPTKTKGSSGSKSKYKSAAVLSGSDGEGTASPELKKKKKRAKAVSADGAEESNTGFNRPMLLSPALASLLGETHLSRPKTVKALWAYIKRPGHELQDPNDKRYICCDEPMRAVFNTDRVHMMGMNKILSNHLYNPDDVVKQ